MCITRVNTHSFEGSNFVRQIIKSFFSKGEQIAVTTRKGLIAIENLRQRLTFVSLTKANLNECKEIFHRKGPRIMT